MHKKLLTSVLDFDNLLIERHDMNYSVYGNDSVKQNPPSSYPCVIIFVHCMDQYYFEYAYQSDFISEE